MGSRLYRARLRQQFPIRPLQANRDKTHPLKSAWPTSFLKLYSLYPLYASSCLFGLFARWTREGSIRQF